MRPTIVTAILAFGTIAVGAAMPEKGRNGSNDRCRPEKGDICSSSSVSAISSSPIAVSSISASPTARSSISPSSARSSVSASSIEDNVNRQASISIKPTSTVPAMATSLYTTSVCSVTSSVPFENTVTWYEQSCVQVPHTTTRTDYQLQWGCATSVVTAVSTVDDSGHHN